MTDQSLATIKQEKRQLERSFDYLIHQKRRLKALEDQVLDHHDRMQDCFQELDLISNQPQDALFLAELREADHRSVRLLDDDLEAMEQTLKKQEADLEEEEDRLYKAERQLYLAQEDKRRKPDES
ncbi:hypothetical protein [Streptococcus oricebi]|uniref:Type III secretion protein n=1 Tax=Streptococcus oricebi TaxID=1547447 RepID=A0ABS5B308_9STRE|nr:hypothetical protein [Streptococcus oricebi]MBP2623218.1 hypothetical protein [Streptococcus oricebi]